MKLPRYTAQTPPPRTSGVARATNIGALVRSSDIAKWQGVGAMGQALQAASGLAFQAYQHRIALDDDIEAGKATQMVEDQFRLAKDAASRFDASADQPLPDDPNFLKTITTFDTTKRDLVTQDLLKGVDKDAEKIFSGIKSSRVKARLVNWYNENYAKKADGIRGVVGDKLNEYQLTEINKLREAAAKNGDVEKADYYANLMDKHELITHGTAEALKKNNKIIADTSLTTQFAQAIMAQTGYQDAIEFVEAQDIDVAVRDKVLSDLATQERIRSTRHKQMREQIMSTMLADVWDGKLKDPQAVTNALRMGYLDDTDAKYLREAIMNPDPPSLKLKNLAIVKQAIEEIGTNAKTRQQALSVLYANLDSIDPTTGKSLVNEIFSEQDKNKSEIKRESRNLMEELVRDRDKFTGMFTDDERQIIASAEAYLMLDAEIQKAVEIGKPLERRDIMIKAIQIGRQMKKKIKAEKEAKTEPFFAPTRAEDIAEFKKRLESEKYYKYKESMREPQFEMTGDVPTIIYDEEGKEKGLRLKNEKIFNIGDSMVRRGFTYKYLGNHQWQKQ